MADDKTKILDLSEGTLQSLPVAESTALSEPSFDQVEPTAVLDLDNSQQSSGFIDLASSGTTTPGDFELATSPDHVFLGTNHTLMGDKGDIELLGIGAGSGIGAKRNSATKIIGLAFGVLCFGFAAYYAYDRFVVNDPSSANTVAESKTEPPVKEAVTTTEEEVAAEEEVEELATVAAIEPEIEPEEAVATNNSNYSSLENLYASLPNNYVNDKGTMGPYWNRGDKRKWNKGLNHKFLYQRLLTIRDMRKARKRGSQEILRKFIRSEQKFWLKFEAAQTLIEFGEVLTRPEIKNIFGATRPALVSRYFTRFTKSHDNSTAYLMRYGLPYVNHHARKHALAALSNNPYSLDNKLYLTAALDDPEDKVKYWVDRQSSRGKVILARRSELAAKRTAIIDQPVSNGYVAEKMDDTVEEASEETMVEAVEFTEDGEEIIPASREVDRFEVEALNEKWENNFEKTQEEIPEIKEIEFYQGE